MGRSLFFCALLLSILSVESLRQVDDGPRNTVVNPFLFFLETVPSPQTLSTVSSNEVDSLISHISGLLPLHSSARQSFPKTSIFSKPKANLVFFVESLEKGELKQIKSPIVQIKPSPEESALSLLTTMVTGASTQEHGILGRQWKEDGFTVDAFSTSTAGSLKANLADVVLQTHEGKSLIVSASADKQLASALSPHLSQLWQVDQSNCYNLYWNGTAFGAATPFAMSSEQIFNLLGEKVHGNLISLETPSGTQVQFDLSHKADFLLFAEALFFPSVLRQIASRDGGFYSLATDNVVDFYSFAISSLKPFPVGSAKRAAAALFLEKTIVEASQIFEKELSSDQEKFTYTTTVISLGQEIASYRFLSARYAEEDTPAPSPAPTPAPTPSNSTQTPTPAPTSAPSGDVTEEDVAIYQTCLWTGVLLILAILYALYALVYMPIYMDPIIFRPTFK